MNIILGKTEVNLMNPPRDGTVDDGDRVWVIGRDWRGRIVLRQDGHCHPEFLDGMSLLDFCSWVNSKL